MSNKGNYVVSEARKWKIRRHGKRTYRQKRGGVSKEKQNICGEQKVHDMGVYHHILNGEKCQSVCIM